MRAQPVPSWVIQQKGGMEARAPRRIGLSNHSVITSACDRVTKLMSGASSLRRRIALGIVWSRVLPDGRVGWPFMKGRPTSMAALMLSANSSHLLASRAEKYLSSSAVRAGSFQKAREGPSGSRCTWKGSATICRSPCLRSSRSFSMVVERNSDAWMPPSLMRCPGADGKIGLVASIPPETGEASRTTTRLPALAR
jgi:hypothetical protein